VDHLPVVIVDPVDGLVALRILRGISIPQPGFKGGLPRRALAARFGSILCRRHRCPDDVGQGNETASGVVLVPLENKEGMGTVTGRALCELRVRDDACASEAGLYREATPPRA